MAGAYRTGTFVKGFKANCKKYGIHISGETFKTHDYRHTLASSFYDEGVSIQTIRDYLGHNNENMTKQYIDYMPKRIEQANKEYFNQAENLLATGIIPKKRVKKLENKIHIYELDCYKNATEEQKKRMRVRKDRYFDLEGLPSEEVRKLLEDFVWERGKKLAPSSLASEILYFNNIRNFLIEKNIKILRYEDENKIILQLKSWMMEKGYALTSKKYRSVYEIVATETPGIIKHMKKILRYSQKDGGCLEQERDVWELDKFEFPLRSNPIKNVKTINFKGISQITIRKEVKTVIFMHLKYMAIGSIMAEMVATKRFCRYLALRYPKIISLLDLTRDIMESYLIYLQTEAKERKNYRSDLYGLRRVIEDVGNHYDRQDIKNLFISTDFPSTPRYLFKFYSDETIKKLNENIFQMDEQIARALILHQLLGTRISDTLTLKTDCLSIRENRYFIRIEQVKSITFEKAISDEIAQLIIKSIDYTEEHYGKTKYIFVKKEDPLRPFQYSMLQHRVMQMIRKNDIRDENGELLNFGTHTFRHCYGKKLTEMHIDDWMIARLLGHKTLQSVHHYRKIGNKIMADETRAVREKIDMILMDVVKEWDGYEI